MNAVPIARGLVADTLTHFIPSFYGYNYTVASDAGNRVHFAFTQKRHI